MMAYATLSRKTSQATDLERLEAEVGEGQHGHPLVELDAAAEPLRDGMEHLCMMYIVYVCVYVCVVAAASATDGRLCLNARAVE